MRERCPLYPRKRTFATVIEMSALCQKQTAHQPPSCLILQQAEFWPYSSPASRIGNWVRQKNSVNSRWRAGNARDLCELSWSCQPTYPPYPRPAGSILNQGCPCPPAKAALLLWIAGLISCCMLSGTRESRHAVN